MTLLAQRDVRGCSPIGALDEYVQALDSGEAARSLHHLAGQLHSALGREPEVRRWVAAVRQRFDANHASTFECELGTADARRFVCDPQEAPESVLAAEALRAMLRGANVGDAVVYSSFGGGNPQSGVVSAAAVRVSPKRAVGIAIVRDCDAVSDESAVLQYLAALAWHLQCADAAATEMRALEGRPSATDLVEMFPLPCVLTDSAGRSIERNEAFGDFMDAVGMRVSLGRMIFEDPYTQDSWHVALKEIQLTAVRQSLLVASADGSQWRVHLVPTQCPLEDGDVPDRALILVMAESLALGSEVALDRALHEEARPLTPAESEVLNALLQGHSAKVIANSRGASVNTVRSQIMTILDKTGHHNQKSLMAAYAPSGFRISVLPGYSIGMPRPSRPGR
ncbi:MAG TPA: helix-turn-helix transcriptional regulator [Ramlibacter sp.]|nr:helix-turn-helix transcriptional regulator [Ramlibacter sp.]